MGYSVRQAAGMVGISRKTLYAHIKQGKVSASRDANGDKVIDHSELLRVYGSQLETPKDSNQDMVSTPIDIDQTMIEELEKYKHHAKTLVMHNKNLREQNVMLKQLLHEARERERESAARHEKTLSIFERLLPALNTK